MRKMKFYEKVLMALITAAFITTFFFSTIIAYKQIEEDPKYFIAGIVIFAINIAMFSFAMKLIKRHYNYRNHKGVRTYFYTIITIAALPTLGYLAFYDRWTYMLVYFFLIAMYAYLINKEFGRLSIKIDKRNDGDLYADDLYSFNGDVKVRGKDKKVKGSMDIISVGDTITISRGQETILTLNVIKNAKKS